MVLPKPFEKQDLEHAVTRAVAIAELQMSAQLRRCVAGLQALPVLPEVYRRVSAELSQDDPDVDRVAGVISDQPQVLARLLQISNSALFGFTTPSKDTQQVVMRLGLDMVKHLVLFPGLFSSEAETEHAEQIADLANEAQAFCREDAAVGPARAAGFEAQERGLGGRPDAQHRQAGSYALWPAKR